MKPVNLLPVTENLLTKKDIAISLNEIMQSLWFILPTINPDLGAIEPPAAFLREGLQAYADGVNWDPGSGKGLYRRDGSAWTKIG